MRIKDLPGLLHRAITIRRTQTLQGQPVPHQVIAVMLSHDSRFVTGVATSAELAGLALRIETADKRDQDFVQRESKRRHKRDVTCI